MSMGVISPGFTSPHCRSRVGPTMNSQIRALMTSMSAVFTFSLNVSYRVSLSWNLQYVSSSMPSIRCSSGSESILALRVE